VEVLVMARAVAVLMVLMSLAACGAVLAQAAADKDQRVTIELKEVDVRSAIEALFKDRGKNFSIDGNVTGTVAALSFRDVPFDTALKQLTRSSGLVFRMDAENGIYIITKRPETTAGTGITPPPVPVAEYLEPTTERETKIEKIPLNYNSATEILAMLGQGGGRDYSGLYNNMNSAAGFSPFGSNNGNNYGGNYGNNFGNSFGNNRYGSGYSPYGNNYGSGYNPYGVNYGGSNNRYGSSYSSPYGNYGASYGTSTYRSW
jgi:type II secretory pathway component HofQ